MLEVRYNTGTKEVTAWCGDERQFGNLERDGNTVVILDIPIPTKPLEALLYDEATQTLMENPDYVETAKLFFTASPPGLALGERLNHIEDFLKEAFPG